MQLKVGDRTTCGRGIVVFADEQDIAIQWWGITTHGSFTSWYTPEEIVKYGLEFVCDVEAKLEQEAFNHELEQAAGI